MIYNYKSVEIVNLITSSWGRETDSKPSSIIINQCLIESICIIMAQIQCSLSKGGLD